MPHPNQQVPTVRWPGGEQQSRRDVVVTKRNLGWPFAKPRLLCSYTTHEVGPHRRARPAGQRSRRPIAQAVISWRDESCSLRSTEETWVSTVFTEMNSSFATSLYW